MDKLIGRLAENELIVDNGFLLYRFRPLSGMFERSNKRKLKIRFILYNETAPLFEYVVSKSDGFIYQGRKVRVRERDLVWLLKRGTIKEG
jgi:hypothetical protein